jgi:hypothetical protein
MQEIGPREILQGILAVVLVLILPPSLSVLLIILPIRLIVSLIAKHFRPDLNGMVTGMSATVTCYPSTSILYFLLIDGSISIDRLRFLFRENVIDKQDTNGEYIYEKLKQTWTIFCGFTFWQKDKHFKLEHHVREYDYDGDMKLSSGCTEEDARRAVSGLLGAPWQKGQSPWEAFLVPMHEHDGNPRTLFVLRHHHILADGYSTVGLLKSLALADFQLPSPKRSYQKRTDIGAILRIPYDFAGILLDSWDFQHDWHFPVDGKPREFLTAPFKTLKVDMFKEAKVKAGVSYAAALFAAVGGGIQRIFEEAELPVPEYLTTNIPFPRRNHPGGLENHLNMCVFRWSIKAGSTMERAKKIQKTFSHLTKSVTTGLLFLVPELIGLMPVFITDFLANTMVSGGSVLSTSFPVPEQQIYFDGNPARGFFCAFGPPGNSIGTSVLMAGINGDQGIVLNMDKRIFPSEQVFRRFGEYVEEELRNLL